MPEEKKFIYLPGQERVKAWMNHLIAEAIEVKESLGYTHEDQLKHWKNDIDWDHVLEEFADILHFLLAAWMEVLEHKVLNRHDSLISDEQIIEAMVHQIFERYKTKVEENHARQERGY